MRLRKNDTTPPSSPLSSASPRWPPHSPPSPLSLSSWMKSKRMVRILKLFWGAVVLSVVLIIQNFQETVNYLLPDVFSSSPLFDANHPLTTTTTTTTSTTDIAPTTSTPPSEYADYAYAFVMAGCNPDRPETFRGVLYSILVNAQLLESYGSKADILVLVQMAHDATTDTLHQATLRRFKAFSNIVLRYLPKPVRPLSFYETQMIKFQILKYTRYRRVLYLDYDVMPLCSLDYLFDLSERGIFQENMAMAGHFEPANSAFMMLRPGRGEYQQLLKIVEQRDANMLVSSTAKGGLEFDQVAGWGHRIEPPDYWKSRYQLKNGTLWNFPAAYADQGLMYHWIKYVKQNATLFIGNVVEHWSSSPSGPVLKATVVDALKGYECPSRLQFPHDQHAKPPYDMEGQLWHFWDEKPWMMKNIKAMLKDVTNGSRAVRLWFQALDQVKRRLTITFDLQKELRESKPTGLWSTPTDMKKTLERRHAYVFLMAGVDPARPRNYRGVLFSILVNAQVLEKSGSQADVVILVQMHFKAKGTLLPPSDLERLKLYPNIVLHYLPKPLKPLSFYDLHLQKFYILELTQYRRVMYLDADVMLLCNLDYLFHMSERGYLKENIIMAGDEEPALGTLLMLRPGAGEHKRLMNIIDQRDKAILMSRTQQFNTTLGWGHIIQPPDRWRARYNRKTGKLWNFPAAYGDQGLVYHWAKYVKKNVSIFIGNEVENWSSSSSDPDAGPKLESTMVDVIKGHECQKRLRLPTDAFSKPPYDLEGQMWHFQSGRPWMQSIEDQITASRSKKAEYVPYRMWLGNLDQVKIRLNTRLNIQKTLRKAPMWFSESLEQDFQNSLARKYAYVFMIANCYPEKPEGYVGMLYGVLVNAQLLENWGSTSDIVVMVQMAHDSEHDYLLDADVTKLKSYGVVIRYLPKPLFPLTFYEVQLQKFRILEFFQYRRVLFLDADVMPLCNFDYLFHLSDAGYFKENMVIAGNNEPANGGFMLLRPGIAEYQELRSIIETRDATVLESSATLSLDKDLGWGHAIKTPDRWRSRYDRLNGTRWDFIAAFCDQGLMYHWTKYVKKSVSLFAGNEVENWSSSDESDGPVLEETLVDALKGYECSSRMLFPYDEYAKPPYDLEGQFQHFDGKDAKPWTVKNLTEKLDPNITEYIGYQMWFRAFDQVKIRLNIEVDLEKDVRQRSQMKHWSAREDFEMILKRKEAVFV